MQRLSNLNEWRVPRLSRIGQADEAALKRLESVLHQLPIEQTQKRDLAAALGKARINTLRQAEVVLTGPTGERNVLSWRAPKQVWLYGGDLATAFATLAELAASGIEAVVESDSPLASYVDNLTGLLSKHSHPETTGVSHVLALEPLSTEHKQSIASQEGALIRIVSANKGVDILQVFEEISCSTNTTAAGGNASLMAMNDM